MHRLIRFVRFFIRSQELQLHLGVLQQHAALIGGPNATSCPICHKLFLGADALMEHMKHAHKEPAAPTNNNNSGTSSKYLLLAQIWPRTFAATVRPVYCSQATAFSVRFGLPRAVGARGNVRETRTPPKVFAFKLINAIRSI